MVQLLEPDDYYRLVAFYIIASQAQAEARLHEKALSSILEDKMVVEKLSDMIYNPSTKGTKKELDELILNNGVSIKWKPTQTKFAKETKEEGTDVGW